MAIGLTALLMAAAGVSGSQPTGHHIVEPREVIALEAGTWDAVIVAEPRIAGDKPAMASGVQVNEVRSGGLWMLNRMSVNGGAYEGTGIWGYDPKTGRYPGVWVDNGTGAIRMDDGDWDAATHTMTWTSRIELSDGRVIRMRATSTFAGNSRTYRSFVITDKGDRPLSTVIFTKRADPVR